MLGKIDVKDFVLNYGWVLVVTIMMILLASKTIAIDLDEGECTTLNITNNTQVCCEDQIVPNYTCNLNCPEMNCQVCPEIPQCPQQDCSPYYNLTCEQQVCENDYNKLIPPFYIVGGLLFLCLLFLCLIFVFLFYKNGNHKENKNSNHTPKHSRIEKEQTNQNFPSRRMDLPTHLKDDNEKELKLGGK